MESTTSNKLITIPRYSTIKLLGEGHVGKVYLVVEQSTNKQYALKVLNKEVMLQTNKVKRMLTEREILATAEHPFIVTFYKSFMDDENLYFLMDYCAGGDLYHLLQSQPGHHLHEEHAKFYAAEVLIALEYLHAIGFIYRDLKPENILIHVNGHIALTDFDLCKGSTNLLELPETLEALEPHMITNSFCGTADYMAPEILEDKGHSAPVDWWALGILINEMLTGHTPYEGRNVEEIFAHIRKHELRLSKELSHSAKSLIQELLNPDSRKRLGTKHGASDIKKHKWFKGIEWNLILNMTPPYAVRA